MTSEKDKVHASKSLGGAVTSGADRAQRAGGCMSDAYLLHRGDSREVLKAMAEGSVDSIVTDPPYHLTTWKKGGSGPASVNLENPYGRARVTTGFMGMTWDGGDIAHDPSFWAECLRVAKPGAWLVAFGGTRTFHRLACAIEGAGWELRDSFLRGHMPQPEDCPWLLAWGYGSGFPKSHNGPWGGAALKPAWEPIVLARKPLIGTVEENWREHGTGALNIDGCRIAPTGDGDYAYAPGNDYEGRTRKSGFALSAGKLSDIGRWPANVIHDGSEEVLAQFPETASGTGAVKRASAADANGNTGAAFGAESRPIGSPMVSYGDAGNAARFFYCAKASQEDRNEGCAGLPEKIAGMVSNTSGQHITRRDGGAPGPRANHHPTVKPTDLMRWLVRLLTPVGGLVLDPFMGSGSAGKAAMLEGMRFTGIDLTAEYVEIARARIEFALRQGHQLSLLEA